MFSSHVSPDRGELLDSIMRAKAIAFYLPQYHEIPENNEWWGNGFTDWVNVKKAKPTFRGHRQPRIPFNKNYYDLSNIESLQWQIDLANQYGLYGFCHYHYWFDGKQLLETPTNLIIRNKSLQTNYCLAWANETWSKRWDGRDRKILQLQTHAADKKLWQKHFDYLITAWTDDRYICIDGMPLFLIYRPHKINELPALLEFWRENVVRVGLKGIFFAVLKQYEFPNPSILNYFDAVVDFQPFESIYSENAALDIDSRVISRSSRQKLSSYTPEIVKDLVADYRKRFGRPTFYDYDGIWSVLIDRCLRKEGPIRYSGAFLDWDNTARYGKRALIFKNASPERFQFWMSKLVDTIASNDPKHDLIFINAWNEWAECAYLEPDENNGFSYLEALRKSIDR